MSVEQLKDVLKLNLEQRGVLNKIKASLRAEIYKAFEEGEDEEVKSRRPPITGQQLVINELIRDYFEWCGYGNALSVFLQESGQPQEPLERRFLVSELGLQNMRPKEQPLPLLFTAVSSLKQIKEQRQRANTMLPDSNVQPQERLFPPAFTEESEPSHRRAPIQRTKIDDRSNKQQPTIDPILRIHKQRNDMESLRHGISRQLSFGEERVVDGKNNSSAHFPNGDDRVYLDDDNDDYEDDSKAVRFGEPFVVRK